MKIIQITTVFFFISFLLNAQSWTQKNKFGGIVRANAASFVINGYAYTGSGYNYSDFWKYDPVADAWTQVANMGISRDGSFAFAIADKGYVGGGAAGHIYNNFYCYDPGTNSWTQKANLPYPAVNAIGFALGGLGYFGTGYDDSNNMHDQIFEYNPVSNLWTFKTTFPGGNRQLSSVFVMDTLAYIVGGTGLSDNGRHDFWAYNPVLNTWALKDSVPGNGRKKPAVFSLNSIGYVCGGAYGSGFGTASLFDFYSYNPLSNVWTALPGFPGLFTRLTSGFSINNIGYVCTGFDGATYTDDLWAYDPSTNGINESDQKQYYSTLVIHNSMDMEKVNQAFNNVKGHVMVYDQNGQVISDSFLNEKKNLTSGIYWFVSKEKRLKVLIVE